MSRNLPQIPQRHLRDYTRQLCATACVDASLTNVRTGDPFSTRSMARAALDRAMLTEYVPPRLCGVGSRTRMAKVLLL